MKLEYIKNLFKQELIKRINKGEILKEGSLIRSGDEVFEIDWCGLNVDNAWDELWLEDYFNEEMELGEIEDVINCCLDNFNNNLMVYDPNEICDSGMGLNDLLDYEVIE